MMSGFDIRDVLRGFRPGHVPPSGALVRWSPAFDRCDGAGARVALLDGGADLAHPDLVGATIVSVDLAGGPADDPADPADPAGQWHATRDLALLVGQGQGGMRGLIPAATLLHARVLTRDGGEPQALADAIVWARRAGARVIVMPLGMDAEDRSIAAAIDGGLAEGVCFVAAAGNGHPRPLDFPARHPGVLAVGGADARGALLPSCCRLPRLDRVAPGCDVPGPGAPGSGSSIACVLAGGVEALLRIAG
jgi:subtilisin family serine protease